MNANVLVKPNDKIRNMEQIDTIPRIINIGCRTEEAFNQLCDWIEGNPQNVTQDFLALLAETMRNEPELNSAGLPYRGETIQ